MKKMKKIFALLIAMVMVLGMSTSVFAAVTEDVGDGPASIQITLPSVPEGSTEDPEITYHVYKVFDATTDGTAISYKIGDNGALSQAMIDAGFFVDDGGNVHYGTFTEDENGTYMVGGKKGTITDKTDLDQTALDAIKAYATDEIGRGFKAKPSDVTLTITGLDYGYYYITTTTGAAVTVDSTKPNAEVVDKNDIPDKPEKKIVEDFDGSVDDAGKNAIAQVGTTVPFSVEIKVAKGATNYVFHDVMSDGLEYDANSLVVDPAASVDNTTTATGDTLTVTFDNDWLAENEGETITITYSAKVTSDALSIDYANNTASLDYGEGNTTDMDEVKVYNAKFTVSKEDGDGEALPGAGFVIANEDGKYYTLTANGIVWVDSIDDADEHVSDNDGAVAPFTGLANGTYTLIEKTVPEGYNKAADSTFTIAEDDYEASNLEQESTVVNEAGSVLPSTGGIGTTIFYIIGAILVIGAGVVLVTRRRMNAN